MSATMDELEKELARLTQMKLYDDAVNAGVKAILARVPPPESEANTQKRLRILRLRCRANLLLPVVSKEAEQDLQAALKLHQGSAEVWVELAECFLRRNAFKEAVDALDNALRLESGCTAALVKYSQVLRNRCGEAGLSKEDRKAFMQGALDKAREAVRSSVDCADGWNAVALTLLAQLTLEGMNHAGLRKAMAAMQQAVAKDDADPDIHYNKGVLNSLVGAFDGAVREFARAYELDNRRQRGTRRLCEDNLTILQRAQSRIKNLNSIGRSELKKLCAAVKRAEEQHPDPQVRRLTVVDAISDHAMQPLTLMTVDASGCFGLMFLYGISFSAVKIGDLVSFPATEKQGEVVYRVDKVDLLDNDPIELPMKQFFVSSDALSVNHKPLPQSAKVSLQVSSRLFA